MTRVEASQAPLLEMRGIRKSFGGVEVVHGVDFDVRAGEIHALCGENGAGKSTLMNVLGGVLRPDAGSLVMDGREQRGFASPQEAGQRGIAVVFQERSLFRPLDVAENIFAGRQPVTRWGWIDRRKLHRDAAEILRTIAPQLRTTDVVSSLSPAEEQLVEIAKALSIRPRIVVFDEPTAALSAGEVARLFAVIRQLKSAGAAIVYISHRLAEIFELADRVTVLKDGSLQGTIGVAETNPGDLVRRMVGRDVEMCRPDASTAGSTIVFEVRGLSDPDSEASGKRLLRDVSLHVCAGEVVGLAGLAGAGRTETALSVFGARPRGPGEVLIGGQRVEIRSPSDAVAAGLGYVSEDRKDLGLFLEMSLSRNIAAANLRRFGDWLYSDRTERAVAEDFRERLRIVSRSADQEVGRLSGGNQQKVLLARWLLLGPRVLIVDEPTRGVDVGAKAEVHHLLYDFARKGGAVLVISSELPEILAISDRIYVMRAGRIAGEIPGRGASEESVLRLAAGAA